MHLCTGNISDFWRIFRKTCIRALAMSHRRGPPLYLNIYRYLINKISFKNESFQKLVEKHEQIERFKKLVRFIAAADCFL
jgi:hypothetical protein